MTMQSTLISGVKINDEKFNTTVEFGWLLDHVISGETLEEVIREQEDKAKGIINENTFIDERTLELAKVRSKMQRPFKVESVAWKSIKGERIAISTLKKTPKSTNAYGPLKEYLLNNFAASPKGSFGVLPAFVLLYPEALPEKPLNVDIANFGSAEWTQYDISKLGRAVAVDGESRIAAAMSIRNDPKVAHTLKDQLMRQKVNVEVYHGLSEELAAQAFIDLNFEGVKVDNITRANIDPRNKWVEVTRRIFDELEIKLATDGRQITTAHVQMGKMLLLTHAVQMVKSIVLGAGAVQKKEGPKSWEDVDFIKLHKAGIAWFREMFDHFGGPDVLVDKSRVVRSVPVRVALSSLGSAHYVGSVEKKTEASRWLKEINWTVSPAWNGLGGVVTKKETGEVAMSSGSGKELCNAAISALTKPETINGRAIRKLGSAE